MGAAMTVDTSPPMDGLSTLVESAVGTLPPAPRTLRETGLEAGFLVELTAKVLFNRGQISLADLSDHLKLPPSVLDALLGFMRAERLVEVVRRGERDGDVHFQLTDTGRSRAAGYVERRAYAGAAPVSLAAYVEAVDTQSVAQLHVTREQVHRAYADVVVRPQLLDQIGAAMNSGRAIFLFGPPGSGKTYLAERLRRLLHGDVLLPHAILVGGEVVQLFDPLLHEPVRDPAAGEARVERPLAADTRWVRCRRPFVLSGGELRLSMLDLDFDESTRNYQAPPHLKANNGVYVVDDLGRQQVRAQDLLNRWIVPLDRRIDYLSLRSGHKFAVPFDVVVVFSTNLRPLDLADDAFLRRIGHKIRFEPMSEPDYGAVFRNACQALGVAYSEPVYQSLLRDYHAAHGTPLLPCIPRDLLSQVRDYAVYEGAPPQLTAAALERAWHDNFIEA
jgi:energy-coupling factor transporter ATP-binding protein EcfA2